MMTYKSIKNERHMHHKISDSNVGTTDKHTENILYEKWFGSNQTLGTRVCLRQEMSVLWNGYQMIYSLLLIHNYYKLLQS